MTTSMTKILAFGGGVDSTALALINLNRDRAAALIGISRELLDEAFPAVDAVFFSDTGAERSATYANVDQVEQACLAAGVRFVRVKREKETITEWLLRTGTVPLMPGGSHLCSLKFKTEVMHKQAELIFGSERFAWSIGIEANEDRRAFTVRSNEKHVSLYPLRNLGLSRAACEDLIAQLGWSKVPKSSCVFCPFMKPWEIREVMTTEPAAWQTVKQVEKTFSETSSVKHGAWLAAGRPVNSAGKALRGMWRRDSWRDGVRLFVAKVNGKQLSVDEWEAELSKDLAA
jgi:hypothetical protein